MMIRSVTTQRARVVRQIRSIHSTHPPFSAPPPPPPRTVPHGRTIRPSAVPSSPHPYSGSSYDSKLRLLTFVIGAGVGVTYYAIAVHAEAAAETVLEAEAEEEFNAETVPESQISDARSFPGLYIWGNNNNSTGSDGVVIPEVFDGKVLRDVVLSRHHAAAVTEDGDLVQWKTPAPTAPSSRRSSSAPQVEATAVLYVTVKGKDFVQIACTDTKVYALCKNGDTYCIDNLNNSTSTAPSATASSWNSLTSPATEHSITKLPSPSTLRWSERIMRLSAGAHHAVALTDHGQILSLSADESGNAWGQLGHGAGQVEGNVWKVVEALKDVKVAETACGDNHTIVRTTDGRAYGFGSNSFGQLASEASITSVPSPTELNMFWTLAQNTSKPLDASCTHIAAGGNTSLFCIDRPAATDVLACGTGLNGQLGNASYAHMTSGPVRVKTLSGLTEWDDAAKAVRPIRVKELVVAPSGSHCGAVLNNAVTGGAPPASSWWPWGRSKAGESNHLFGYDVFLWGGNRSGQLARNDHKKSNSPVPLHPRPLAYSQKGAQADGRLQLAPVGRVSVRERNGKERKVKGEQKLVLGEGISGVYMKAI
ncbi:regulator of chromosome condensation 1/beta-lactamase-inhibitor protein II [Powellomyces hirtus]|nr:regulator of chromosome condensation 1/beta-lactamase-inhibitor protein II [Powellomyces hirtus]